jgi:hypothetical protein
VAVEHFRGPRLARVPLDGPRTDFEIDALDHQACLPSTLPTPCPVAEPFDLRRRMLGYLDWEHVTPTDEIHVGTLRGRLKRSLRGLRDRHLATA